MTKARYRVRETTSQKGKKTEEDRGRGNGKVETVRAREQGSRKERAREQDREIL